MFIIIWEFRPTANRREKFELAYGRSGAWVQLFSRAPVYIETELIRDVDFDVI